MRRSWQRRVQLVTTIALTGLAIATFSRSAGAGPISGLPVEKSINSISMMELSHCRPWPHWHQLDRWGRGCNELSLPRERSGSGAFANGGGCTEYLGFQRCPLAPVIPALGAETGALRVYRPCSSEELLPAEHSGLQAFWIKQERLRTQRLLGDECQGTLTK
jgi:hypothetical protein